MRDELEVARFRHLEIESLSETPMDLIQQLLARARANTRSVVFPEGRDPLIAAAARRIKDEQIADPILLGSTDQIESAVAQAEVDLEGIRTIDPRRNDWLDSYAAAYAENRRVNSAIARRIVGKPLYFGGMMVACHDAEAMVGGVASATATVIQAARLTIGTAAGMHIPSSFFLMVLPEFAGQQNRPLIYADCAFNIDPSAEELAEIALVTARNAAKLLDEPPRVAMLSFSTLGSAIHARVDKVSQALEIARSRAPELAIDGEFQVDTALIDTVAAKKLNRSSDVAGQANVLIFPDLDAGNISYKLTQALCGARALGPILQGFAKPVCDLSRGASIDDIVESVAITLAQS